MEFDPEDQDIIRLLAKLKEADEKYPEDMLAARRSSYLKRMSELGLGVGAEEGIKQVAKQVKAPATASPATSTILEMALVVAIIAETGAMAYFYRDKLADFFKTISAEARGQEVTPAPVVPTTLAIQGITPSPAITATLPSATLLTMPTPTGTPVPGVADGTGSGVNLLNSTPAPNGDDENNGNNGHHYGQTPKPERTKANGNNPPPKDNNDKPPKDNNDKPPKDNNGQPQNDKQPKKP